MVTKVHLLFCLKKLNGYHSPQFVSLLPGPKHLNNWSLDGKQSQKLLAMSSEHRSTKAYANDVTLISTSNLNGPTKFLEKLLLEF